jgi:hypothetical protein
MGTFTALDNPLVDQTVQDHLDRIVSAIRSHLEPQAIVLRFSQVRKRGRQQPPRFLAIKLCDHAITARRTPHGV